MAVTSDGRTAVSGSDDRTVRVWGLATGQALATFHAENAVTSCAMNEDGQSLWQADTGGRVHFLKLEL